MVAPRRISVVVRCRNEAEHLPKSIYGLHQQTIPVDEVVLVDSGSTDSSVRLAEGVGWKVVTIRPEDFSFGRSLNYGCEAATGDLIVVLSAHVYPVRVDFIEKITAPFSGSEQMKITYGKQVGDDRSRFSEKVLMSQWLPSERITDQGHAFANNANSCFPRSLWEKLKTGVGLWHLDIFCLSFSKPSAIPAVLLAQRFRLVSWKHAKCIVSYEVLGKFCALG